MRHIKIDRETEAVKQFVRSLPTDPDGSLLELEGKMLFKLLPISKQAIDETKLKAAIMKRRDESRRLNQDWDTVDRETWEGPNRPNME